MLCNIYIYIYIYAHIYTHFYTQVYIHRHTLLQVEKFQKLWE